MDTVERVVAPAGWYRDPAGRHEQRFWDGAAWTAHVTDAGVPGDDAPELGDPTPSPADMAPVMSPAAAGPDAAVATAAPAPIARAEAGSVVVGVTRWRAALWAIALLVTMLTFMFELFASVLAVGSSHWAWSGDTWQWWTSWLYMPVDVNIGYGFVQTAWAVALPPLALWPALILLFIFLTALQKSEIAVLTAAGARRSFFALRPLREERRRLGAGVSGLGLSRTFFRVTQRRYLGLVGLTAAVVALISVAAITGRSATSTTGDAMRDLSVGLGPWVCLIAGTLGVLTAIVLWPWRLARRIVIHADGTVEEASAS